MSFYDVILSYKAYVPDCLIEFQREFLHWHALSGVRLVLPEPLQDSDVRSWFKRFEIFIDTNEWNDEKKFLKLPTLLCGQAWAIFSAFSGEQTQMYPNLKKTILERLSPDKDENRLTTQDELFKRQLGNWESVDELARGIKKLLEWGLARPSCWGKGDGTVLSSYVSTPKKDFIPVETPPQTYHQMITKAENSGWFTT